MKINVRRPHLNFLSATAVIAGGNFPYLASLRQRWFSTSSTPCQECKEDRIAGNKSELSLALDVPPVGDSRNNRGLCLASGSGESPVMNP